MKIYLSQFREPAKNAALEEYFFRSADLEPILLFYRNTEAVVWGRNQNPYLECALSLCLQEEVQILRRISGGGTVYHDLNNLNYSFILPRAQFKIERILAVIGDALTSLSLPAIKVCDRHSIWLDGKKTGGTAFALSGNRAMLHGCLLLDSNLQRLKLLLEPEVKELHNNKRKMLASVRSPVVNMRNYNENLQMNELIGAICENISKSKLFELKNTYPLNLNLEEKLFEAYYNKFRSEEWTMEFAQN